MRWIISQIKYMQDFGEYVDEQEWVFEINESQFEVNYE